MLYELVYLVLSGTPAQATIELSEVDLTRQQCEDRRTEILREPREFTTDEHIVRCRLQEVPSES